MFSGCILLKKIELPYFDTSLYDKKIIERPFKIDLCSVDQLIKYSIYCYKTDSFSKIEQELYSKFPNLKLKPNVYYLACGNMINTFATLEENKIKTDTNIIINYDD